jgi:hypothetical protein
MESAYFQFKNLVAVHFDGVEASCAAPFCKSWGLWRQESPTSAAVRVRVAPMAGLWKRGESPRQFDPNAPFLVRERQSGDGWVVFFHRGEPDIFLRLGETIEVGYRPRPRQTGKLYKLLLFVLQLALARCDAMLIHGAVVVRQEQALLLTGPEDTKKTTLLLAFLRDGWDFLSDDLFLLHDGIAQLFATEIPLREHHFAALPWLQERLPEAANFRRRARRNRRLQAWGRRLPSYCFPLVSRFCPDPSLVVPVERLFPDAARIAEAPLSGMLLLALGETLGAAPLAPAAAVARLDHMQRLLFPDFMVLEQLLVIYGHMDPVPYGRILEANLAALPSCNLALPVDGDPAAVSRLALEQAATLLSAAPNW